MLFHDSSTGAQVSHGSSSISSRFGWWSFDETRSDSSVESPSKKSRDHEVFFSAKVLDELIEHLDTALAFLLTEVIQSNRPKELQVRE